ncbi:MAG: hypothetical protein IJD95_01990 [Clostridia bacterium]|nr:hypothetical protein [Clostridia bacterium]
MKRKITALSVAAVIIANMLLITSCGPSYKRVGPFIDVMEGAFESAGYVVAEGESGLIPETPPESTPTSSESGGGTNGGLSDKHPGWSGTEDHDPGRNDRVQSVKMNTEMMLSEPLNFANSKFIVNLELLVSNFLGVNGGVALTESNKMALSGEALAEGSSFAAMARAMMEVYGDAVFANNYSVGEVTFRLSDADDRYVIEGVIFEDGKYRSGFMMSFTKEENGYSYIFAKYSVNDDAQMPSSTLNFSVFVTGLGVVNAELSAQSSEIFGNYETAYDSFEVDKMTAAYYSLENYTSVDLSDSSDHQVKFAMDFAKDILGLGNATFESLNTMKKGKDISYKEAVQLSDFVSRHCYVSPYYYETNDTYVRDSYVVPSDVTVVETGSIPATKKVFIHANVTKIESKPFQAPQYLEDIIFADPVNGKLTQIGSFDSSLGHPSFILSLTKVKNFTLPSTVKKLELGQYILNAQVEKIDLSTYNPDWLKDPKLMTCTYNEFWKRDDERAEFKESAYANLTICGTERVRYKELRYIETLVMPQFNMGLRFKDEIHLNIISEKYGDYYAEAYSKLLMQYGGDHTNENLIKFLDDNGYTRMPRAIGTVILSNKNTVVTNEMLFSEFSDEKGADYNHDLFEIELYRDFGNAINAATAPGSPYVYGTVEKIIVPESVYAEALSQEEEQYDRITFGEESNLAHVKIEIKK